MAKHSTFWFCPSSIFKIFLLIVPGLKNIWPWEWGRGHEEIFTTLYIWKENGAEKCGENTHMEKTQKTTKQTSKSWDDFYRNSHPKWGSRTFLFQLSDMTLCKCWRCHLASLQHGLFGWWLVVADILHDCRNTCTGALQVHGCNFALWKLPTQ